MSVGHLFGLLVETVAVMAAVAATVALFVVPRFGTRDAAFVLSMLCVFGGTIVASTATSDLDPLTMGKLYLPFLALGTFSAFVWSSRKRRAPLEVGRVQEADFDGNPVGMEHHE